MAKASQPLFSFKATGSLADSLTFQRRARSTLARQKPTPTNPKTLPQTYQRWLYQDYAAWWNTLTATVKEQWESDARRLRITGFNYWMRTRLNLLPDLVGSWHLDERSGNVAVDSSKNGNNGVIYGATKVAGVIDNALSFDGIDDYVNIPHSDTLHITTDQLTLEAFAYWRSLVGARAIIEKCQWGTGGYRLGSDGTRPFTQLYIPVGAGGSVYGTPNSITTDKWYHIACTYDGTTLKLYIDGLLNNQVATSGNIGSTITPLKLGRYSAGVWQHYGYIDHPLITNRTLTPADVKRHSERRYPL